MSDVQDLSVLNQEVDTITVAGKTMTVNRIRMRQLPKVLELAQPMSALLFKTKPTPGKGPKPNKDEPLDIGKLVMLHGNDLVQLIAEIQSYGNEGVDADWVGDLELDEVIALAGKVFEVNLDFFIQRVVPALSTALASVNQGVSLKFLGGSTPTQS